MVGCFVGNLEGCLLGCDEGCVLGELVGLCEFRFIAEVRVGNNNANYERRPQIHTNTRKFLVVGCREGCPDGCIEGRLCSINQSFEQEAEITFD